MTKYHKDAIYHHQYGKAGTDGNAGNTVLLSYNEINISEISPQRCRVQGSGVVCGFAWLWRVTLPWAGYHKAKLDNPGIATRRYAELSKRNLPFQHTLHVSTSREHTFFHV